jgi:hypothetical protein
MQLINDMTADKENPFGQYLNKLLFEDPLSKNILNTRNKTVQKTLVNVLRFVRKNHNIYRKFFCRSLIESVEI